MGLELMGGGCACGRVRYEVELENDDAYLCHCRMCQRASGAITVAMTNVKRDKLVWLSAPDWYESSPIAKRPFCSRCGTSLGFQFDSPGENMDLTVASFDDPLRFRPTHHFGTESQNPHWEDLEGLPHYPSTGNQALVDKWIAATGSVPR